MGAGERGGAALRIRLGITDRHDQFENWSRNDWFLWGVGYSFAFWDTLPIVMQWNWKFNRKMGFFANFFFDL